MNKIGIDFDKFSIEAKLNDSPTAKQVWAQLPIDAHVNTWGDTGEYASRTRCPGTSRNWRFGLLARWTGFLHILWAHTGKYR